MSRRPTPPIAPNAATRPKLNAHLRTLQPYPPGKPIEEVRREYGLDEVIKLASNENPLGPSPRAMKAMAAVAGEANLYPDGAGFYLKQALAARLGVTTGELLLGNGSDEITFFLGLAYLNRKRGVVTSDYAFVRYRNAAELAGAPLTLVPMRGMTHDLPAIARAITPGTALVCLDLPGNPTGTVPPRAALERFLKTIPREVVVLLDQAYFEYAAQDPAYVDGLALRRLHPNIVVTRTFSKAYGLAGLRVGYAVMRPEMVEDLERIRPPFNTGRLAQAAALAALGDAVHLRKSVELNARGRAQLSAGLEKLGARVVPSLANFVLADFGAPAGPLFEGLLRQGVVVRPMGGYGLTSWLRISVGTAAQNRRCLAALKHLLA